ncbi:SoxR-reducing system protein RseC [Enterobacillus tribolii]|uniref:RseC/MucC-like positive regulator of sigma(E) n=1 Tax=Enterobacillus tribolii TaxID=1487935 RepID=A0A370QPS7_9GAMM|nr:SoxR-reducing system protein RseC [Enterobacillus tribolii]MBW7981971.1 SoxR-reducing system protein RseC [Enterobacillus tribolii]RDK90010.1 RseC/MucC-like positive regulator of sigma(E) [Enterobacillus tribolii]
MMREWATVIAWHQGVATLNCETRSGCGACRAKHTCGTTLLNKLGPQSQHQLQIAVAQPLEPGQKIEIGLTESSLLSSALLVYMTPLAGLLAGGALGQWGLTSDAGAALGALLGAGLGFWLARRLAVPLSARETYQPVVLQIGLPPSALHFQPPDAG